MRKHHNIPYINSNAFWSFGKSAQKAFIKPPGRLINAPTDYSVVNSYDNENFLCVQVISRQLGFDLPDSNRTLTLSTAAEAYFYLGYSVIPLLGDLDPLRPKMPAIPWATYQHYRASLHEQREWFLNSEFAGPGIVTGRIVQNIPRSLRSQPTSLRTTHTLFSTGLPTSLCHCRDSTGWIRVFFTPSSIDDSKTSVAFRLESSEALINVFTLATKIALRVRWNALLFRTNFSISDWHKRRLTLGYGCDARIT